MPGQSTPERDQPRRCLCGPTPNRRLPPSVRVLKLCTDLLAEYRDAVVRETKSAEISIATQSESNPCSEIRSQCWISDYFVVVFVRCVLDVQISCQAGLECIPTAQVQPSVTSCMIDIKA